MLPGGRKIGGPFPGKSTSVTGISVGLDPVLSMEPGVEEEAALIDD